MAEYVIDGVFFAQQLTGIQRYGYEIVRELDKIADKGKIEILVPQFAENIPTYKNIKVVKYGNLKGRLWEQVNLSSYMKKNKLKGIFLGNELPFFCPEGIITMHDISYKVNPEFFTSMRSRLAVIWHKISYYRAFKSKMEILTVSEFSKSEIIKYYKVKKNRISIIYPSWQHINNIDFGKNTFEKYSDLKPNEYYFSMSTLGANKNFKWILYAAKNNPDKKFAIAGGGKLKGAAEAEGFVSLPNIHFLGYVSDEDAKTLMANCKAFIFPTLYEGFGLPPLEAVACGAKKIIVSDTPCMHEVYGKFAEYINPLNYDYIFGNDVKSQIDVNELLDRYSWKKSAEKLYELL